MPNKKPNFNTRKIKNISVNNNSNQKNIIKKDIKQNFSKKTFNYGRPNPEIGRIYQMEYRDAKTAEYWDATPISLIIHKNSKYLLGLSLHYLPPVIRKFFLQKIMLQNWTSLKNGGTVNLPYSDIKNVANVWYREGYAIIRKYLRDRLGPSIMEIPYTNWKDLYQGSFSTFVGTYKKKKITIPMVYDITREQIKKHYSWTEQKLNNKKYNPYQNKKASIKNKIDKNRKRYSKK